MTNITNAIKRFVDELETLGVEPPTEIMFKHRGDLIRVAKELDALQRQPVGEPYNNVTSGIKINGVNLSYNYLEPPTRTA